MEISTIEKIHYRPSPKAKAKLLKLVEKLKEERGRVTLNGLLDEIVIKSVITSLINK
jgi:hypothetical protein